MLKLLVFTMEWAFRTMVSRWVWHWPHLHHTHLLVFYSMFFFSFFFFLFLTNCFCSQLTLLGYNHKLRILLETVVGKIANFEVKPDRFSVIKVTMSVFVSFYNLMVGRRSLYQVYWICIMLFPYPLLGDCHKGVSKLQISTAISPNNVLLLTDITRSDLALDRGTRSPFSFGSWRRS